MEPSTLYELITLRLSNQISPEEDLVLRQWTEADEANQQEYEKIVKIWNDSAKSRPERQYNTPAAWIKVDQQIQSSLPATAKVRPLWARYAAAAAVLALLSAGAWWMTESSSYKMHEVAANEGKIKDLQLDDQTSISLRPGSSIKYSKAYKENKRIVELTGEAWFQVASDASHPFVIKTPNHDQVEVLGTAFTVETSDSGTVVIVTEGSVRLGNEDQNQGVIVSSGKKGISKNGLLSAAENDDLNFLAWKTGTLQFNDLPLVDILPQLADFYSKVIRIDESYQKNAAQQRATITFRDQSCDNALHELQLLLGFKYRQEGDTIVISQ
ncbi:FecR family protein [Chitinophaga sp. Cy-1792]|uniref:FecR family protein n=1 Tax=Chitinophaga sp. Cy-1792 TaxID=2608339 RepID=UPI001423A751|nr:FecR domain-containing protein [Chitinophaga sp. Cy-1792]NIG56057.1 DUF4974 domain-containing protein [Chitinophaga sp. Cy-1792]